MQVGASTFICALVMLLALGGFGCEQATQDSASLLPSAAAYTCEAKTTRKPDPGGGEHITCDLVKNSCGNPSESKLYPLVYYDFNFDCACVCVSKEALPP